MMTFKAIREEGTSGIHFLGPAENILAGFQYIEPRQVDCEQMKIGRAIHFSHKKSRDAFDAGLFPIDIEEGHDESHHRAEGAQVFLDDWRKQCLDQE